MTDPSAKSRTVTPRPSDVAKRSPSAATMNSLVPSGSVVMRYPPSPKSRSVTCAPRETATAGRTVLAAIRVPTSTRLMLYRGAGLAAAPGSAAWSLSDQRYTVVSFAVTTRVSPAPNATECRPDGRAIRVVKSRRPSPRDPSGAALSAALSAAPAAAPAEESLP